MGQWEPLAERIPVDVRRLAVQLRRMKDRGGLTVPALAARTAQSAESWEKYLNGRQLPPLDAVEVLAQASGADYDRVGALWKLAEKAATGTGDRGRGKPVPHPDPLDPLGPEEGLPGNRRRRALLFGTAGVLAIGAAVTVLLAAGPSTGRAPAPEAAPTVTDRAGAPLTPGAKGAAPRTSPGTGGAPGRTAPTAEPSVTVMTGDGSPSAGPPGTPGATATHGAGPGSAPSGGVPGTVPTDTGSPSAPASGGTVSPTDTPTGPPSPTATATGRGGLCLGLLVVNLCVGGQG
ncbi:helix-turn-helix domain-containing protein [Streptomyces sp. NPDC087422]|uniref:helix-turn-helix domain-containing protein n=1 Tax=Streptomyces sp. NPDC087422 TaxID=3365786 RepID=UPI0037FE883F